MTSNQIARAARFSIAMDQLPSLEVKTLVFPFGDAIEVFRREMKTEMRNSNEFIAVPYRQLNRLLGATCPTLTQGFEWNNDRRTRQAFAVGAKCIDSATSEISSMCNPPHPGLVSRAIQAWGRYWMQSDSFKVWMQTESAQAIRDRFLDAFKQPPETFTWQSRDATSLITNLEGLSFDAVPSLLATLLHRKNSVINGQSVTWRRVQEIDGRASLVSSPPYRAGYEDKYGNTREGFFAYKIVFSLETQAGNLKPWVFIRVHVQRYADERLKDKNDSRDISILMGANQARFDDFPTDSTLVSLDTIGSLESGDWNDNLSDLLAAIGARPLTSPAEIYQNPRRYWRKGQDSLEDEFYIVHAEGYKYGDERGRGHDLKTGFSFAEQGEIVAEILKHLPFLIPDEPLRSDIPVPSGKKTPSAMRDFSYLETLPSLSTQLKQKLGSVEAIERELESRTIQRRAERQSIVQQALERALNGETISISILWHNADTRDALYDALRNLFLLNQGDEFPQNIVINVPGSPIPRDLLDAVDHTQGGFKNAQFNKMKAWRQFLQQSVPVEHPNRFALIELLPDSWKVYGAAREACAREGIGSQMKLPVRFTRKDGQEKTLLRQEKAALDNAVRDLVFRQTGALFGLPHEIYRVAGIPNDLASDLAVVAFYLKRTRTNMTYPVVMRLCPDGKTEILLPHKDSDWLPYPKAGPVLGQIFADTGSFFKWNKSWVKKESRLSLTSSQLLEFLTRVLVKELDTPTLVLIEADVWRDKNKGKWEQLKNHAPFAADILDFGSPNNPFGQPFQRTDKRLANLLAVIRIRSGDETPQYIPSANAWGVDKELRDFANLTGLIDTTVPGLLHYYSIGGIPITAKGQDAKSVRYSYMMDGTGAGVAFKHQQMIELMPFFVHPRLKALEMQMALCRVPHYLRVSPAWTLGNISSPYPSHLGEKLIEDQLCIIGMDE